MIRKENRINLKVNLDLNKRTSLNYTHTVNIDSQINFISSWRKSKAKFNQNFIKNILTFGILHIVSLFIPKLYLKLYCKPCSPKESDFFLVEDINGFSSLCKSFYKNEKIMNSSSNYSIKFNKKVTFEYYTMKYEYDERTNTINPIYFNLCLFKNNELIHKYSEGLSSEDIINNLKDKFGLNVMKLKKIFFYEFYIRENLHQLVITIFSVFFFSLGKETKFGGFIFYASFSTILIRILYKYITFRKLYNKDNSLDGKQGMKKYKVIRKNKQNSQSKYSYIKSSEILPGDIILLREEDLIPCDGIILEGECLLNINFLSGNTDNILRKAIENNKNYFNYVINRKSVVFHGMKIIKIYTKKITKEITIRAINTGSNTYKANYFGNLLIKRKDEKIYRNISKNFVNKYYLIFAFIIFCLSNLTILIINYKYNKKSNIGFNNYILVIIGLIMMPQHFIIENLIKLLSIMHLNNHKIQCIDESKIPESANIDTVIFSKSGNKNEYKIISFCPLYFEPQTKKISIKFNEQNEEQNIINIINLHMKYYKNITSDINNNERNNIIKNLNDEIKNDELNALFLQSIICCNNLKKINNEICGESIDKEILEKTNWDINSIEIKDENDKYDNIFIKHKEKNEKLICLIEEIKKKGTIFIKNYDNNITYNSFKIISEVFPKDYYKITEGKTMNLNIKKNLFFRNNINENNIDSKEKKYLK